MNFSRIYLLISLLMVLFCTNTNAQGKDATARIAGALNGLLPLPKGINFSAEDVKFTSPEQVSRFIQRDNRFTKEQREEIERRTSPQKNCKQAISYEVAIKGLCGDWIYFAGISCGGLNGEFYFYFYPDPNSKCIDQYYEWIEAGLITPNHIAQSEGEFELCFPQVCLAGQGANCCVNIVQAVPIGKECWEDNCNTSSDCDCRNTSFWLDLTGAN